MLMMSMFNVQMLCNPCKDIEFRHPDYDRAREAEYDAVMRGDFDYEGIGLPPDLM